MGPDVTYFLERDFNVRGVKHRYTTLGLQYYQNYSIWYSYAAIYPSTCWSYVA